MLRISSKKNVKRLSDKKSALIIVGAIFLYLLITWLLGADYSDSLRRISY